MTTSEQQQVGKSILASSTIKSRARALTDFRIHIALIKGLLNKEPLERANALDQITQLVKDWAKECHPPVGSTAGTVSGDGRGNVSGVSSPLNNSNNVLVTPISSQRSSVSDGNNPLNSPLFTDGSGSASASSYAASPVVDSGFNVTPITTRCFPNTSDEGVDINECENIGIKQGCVNQKNATGLQRDEISDGPSVDSSHSSQQQQRRNSAGEISADDTENSRNEYMRLLILAMLRMSIDCPFPDVRNSFNKCLNKLRTMGVSVPAPINPSPSFYIAPEDILTLEWPLEDTTNSLSQNALRSAPVTPSRCSLSSSSSSNSSSFSEEIPRAIQQPLTPSTPFCSSLQIGRQPDVLVRKLMVDTFVEIGRLSHFYRILSYFPSFMERYQEAYSTIIRADGGRVPINWRYYIGIMAASQHKCQYIVSKLTDDFLLNGGNIDWLQGLQYAPTKIRNLAKLNTILAHQPWRLQVSHIKELIKGSSNPHENWAFSEIVHVIVILSTFHSLSSYVLGCGIVPEYDSIGGNCDQPPWTPHEDSGDSIGILSSSERISPDIGAGLGVTLDQGREHGVEETEELTETNVTAECSSPITIPRKSLVNLGQPADVESLKHTSQLIKRLRNKRELQLSSHTSEDLDRQINFGSVSSDGSYSFAKIAEFENVEEETFTDELSHDIYPSSPFPFPQEFFPANDTDPHILTHPAYNQSLIKLPEEDFSRFLDPSVEIPYADFIVNSPEYNVFKLQDYCWETEGVVMVNKYMPGVGELLDKEFAEIRDLSDYCLFHSYKFSDVDTTPLRQAIWYYVLRLFGLLKDDYEYRDLSSFLNVKIKSFLKKVCCTPEEIEFTDWRNVGFRLCAEEKCHVNLIAVEARKQAELIYGLSVCDKWDSEERMVIGQQKRDG